MKKSLIVIGLFVIIDVLGFSLTLPLLPFLTDIFQMTAFHVGIIQSSNSIAQLIAVPFIGTLSDTYGRKPLLLFCSFGTFVSFVLFGMANSFWMLVFSRVLDGIIGGNISLAKSYVADVTSEDDRSIGMGIIGAAFGIAFVFGPAVGGILVEYNYYYPSMLAALLSLINFVGVYFFLEESEIKSENTFSTPSQFFKDKLKDLNDCIRKEKMRDILFFQFLYLVIFTMFECSFGFFSIQKLSLEPRKSSYLLAFFGIVYAYVQGSGIKRLKSKYPEDTILSSSLLLLSISFTVYVFVSSVPQYMILLVPLGLSIGVSNTLISTKMSKEVEPGLIGGTFGLSAALGSLTRIIAPAICGFMIDQIGIFSPYILCCLLSLFLYSKSRK